MNYVLKQASATIDKRTTPVCLHAAGQIVPVNEPFDTINGKYQNPPFHVHCRTLSIPWVRGMVNDMAAEANSELMRRPSKQRDWRQFKGIPPSPLGSSYRGPTDLEVAVRNAYASRKFSESIPSNLARWEDVLRTTSTQTREDVVKHLLKSRPKLTTEQQEALALWGAGVVLDTKASEILATAIWKTKTHEPLRIYRELDATLAQALAGGTSLVGKRVKTNTMIGGAVAQDVVVARAAGGQVVVELIVPSGVGVLPTGWALGSESMAVGAVSGVGSVVLESELVVEFVEQWLDAKGVQFVRAIVVG